MLNKVIEELKVQTVQWRLRVTEPLADKSISPHPGNLIADLLTELFYLPEFPRELDQVVSRLHREVREAIPKFPSMEKPGDDWVLPILQHVENFTNMLLTNTSVKPPTPDLDGESFMTPANLAQHYNVDKNVLRKRLERLRRKDHNCFTENPEATVRESRFSYRLKYVLPIIEKIRNKPSN